jgi:hypothetical protein
MISKFIRSTMSMPKYQHAALAGLSALGFGLIKPQLDASYLASRHPVDYATGQLSFSAELVKGYYAHMIDIYWKTQFIDFGFIAAVFCLGLFFATAIARVSRLGSWGRWLGMAAGFAAMSGATADAFENFISFVMLSNPNSFPSWIAVVASTFSALKFAMISSAILGCVASLFFAFLVYVLKKPQIG